MAYNIYSFYYAKNKKKRNSLFLLLCIFLVIFVCVFTVMRLLINGENYSEKTYYFFSTDKTKDKGRIEQLQKLCTDSGGAGYVYSKDNTYYILAFVYKSKEKAEVVLNKNSEVFINSSIKEITLKKIKSKTIRKIKTSIGTASILEYINSLVDSVYQLYLKNFEHYDKVTCLNELTKLNIKCDEFINYIDKFSGNEIANVFSQYLQIFKGLLTSCTDCLYKGESIPKNLSKLAVNMVFTEYEFRKAIN